MSLERLRNIGWPAWAAIVLALGLAVALLVPDFIRMDPPDEGTRSPAVPTASSAPAVERATTTASTDSPGPRPRKPFAEPGPHEDAPASDTPLEPFDATEPAVVATEPADAARPSADDAPPADAALPSEAPPATVLLGIDAATGEDGESVEIVLRADGTISNPHVFTIEGPDRLVVDLKQVANAMDRTVVKLDSGRVTRIRSGTHDDTLRLVFDAGDVEAAFDPRRLEPLPDGLRIRLGGSVASPGLTDTIGTVQTQAGAQPPVASIAPSDDAPSAVEPAAPLEDAQPTHEDAPLPPSRALQLEEAPALVAAIAPHDEEHPPVASIVPSELVPDATTHEARPIRAPSPLPSYLHGRGTTASGTEVGFGLEGDYDCIIEPFDVVEVGSALTAVVRSVAVERSDFVEAGQVLAELESSPERAAVEVARARAGMDANLIARQARMELSHKKQKRADQLFESQTLSADLRDEIRTEAEVAKAVLEEAREAKQLTELEYREAIERLDEHTIKSPISGVVIDRLKSPGEVVKEETILVIAQIDPLRVEVILPAAAIGTVRPGMRAEVFPEIPKAGVQVASVTVVDRVIDATSGTFGVRLELSNPDYAVPSGLRCQVRFLPVD